MNVSRENLGDLDLCIKIDIVESDYADKVAKVLKDYQHKAQIPGFRKGMAPMGMIQRLYKTSAVADTVEGLLSENLYKYIEDEKLELLGSPLSNEEKTGNVDFAKATDFTFYFDAALAPEVSIDWSKVDEKLATIKVSSKEVDEQMESIRNRFGKFESPDTIGVEDYVYGKIVELDKEGNPKEDGISVFGSFPLESVKDQEISALFLGKKASDKVVFNMGKAFTPSMIEKHFRLDNATAKKFKSDVEFTVSGNSHVVPAELNEELFSKVFPDKDIKDADAFRKAVSASLEESYAELSQLHYVNQVRKQLLDQFSAPMPEAFLKRWFLSRGDKNVTAESIENEWADKYLPSLKWELIDAALNKIKPIEPTQNQVVDHLKGILKHQETPNEGEDEKQFDERLEQAARTIAQDRRNVQQFIDKLYVENTFALFKENLNPEVEKLTYKEFEARTASENKE